MKDSSVDRLDYISFANVIATFSVVFLHINTCFWDFSATEKYWKSANVIECVFYFAVPVFFMITGATLLDFYERYDLKAFFTRRIKKTLIPYLAWSIIVLIAQVQMGMIDKNIINLKYIINGLCSGSMISIYWFFPALFGVYLSIPVLAAIPPSKKLPVFKYLLSVSFVINILIPFLNNIFKWQIGFPMYVTVGSGYLFYVCAGYVICNTDISFRSRLIIYGLSFVGLFMHMIGTWSLSMEAGQIVSTYKGYWNAPCVLYSIGIFLLLKQIGPKIMRYKGVNKLISEISKYTFGIYLTHLGVFWLICRIFPTIDIRNLLWRLVAPLIIFGISAGGIKLARRIPGIKFILP